MSKRNSGEPGRDMMRLVAAMAVVFSASIALAQVEARQGSGEFSLDIGYANVSVGSGSVLDNENALHIEPAVTFAPIQQLPQLRLGGDVGFSMVLDNSSRTIVSGDHGIIFVGSSDVPAWFIEPELRLSWRQSLGDNHQFFIEPGIAGGIAFGHFELDAGDVSHDHFSADDNTLFGRVFLRLGAQVTGGSAGIEASYLSGGDMDFGGNASGDFREWYIGIFGALYF